MSRIGKKPVAVPQGVTVTIEERTVKVKGPKGELQCQLVELVDVKLDGEEVVLSPCDDSQLARSAWGLSRTLVANMVTGVTDGFSKTLEINGVGYRAEVKGSTLVLNLGYSHPIEFQLPDGVTAKVEGKNTQLVLSGIDKQVLGQAAANIRGFRPPEPYKGKGVRYQGEHVRRKAGKTAGA